MNKTGIFSLVVMLLLPFGANAAKSFLTAASFPKTFNDLPFTDRMAVLQAGYEPWETEYDDAGRCISGCAYPGITIEKEEDMMQRQTQYALHQLHEDGYTLPSPDDNDSNPPETTPQPPIIIIDDGTPPNNNNETPPAPHDNIVPPHPQPPHPIPPQPMPSSCRPNQPAIPAAQRVPLGEPLTGHPTITSQYGRRKHPVTGRVSMHKGVDFRAPLGTDVFSPASGTVASVWTDNTCGNGIRITHSDGFETVYCHLSRQMVSAGDTVAAGCRIGQSGNTGRSTGPHLHYGIKHNGTYINPNELIGR